MYNAAGLEDLFKQWYIAPYYFVTITLLAISVAIVCFPGRNNYWQVSRGHSRCTYVDLG